MGIESQSIRLAQQHETAGIPPEGKGLQQQPHRQRQLSRHRVVSEQRLPHHIGQQPAIQSAQGKACQPAHHQGQSIAQQRSIVLPVKADPAISPLPEASTPLTPQPSQSHQPVSTDWITALPAVATKKSRA